MIKKQILALVLSLALIIVTVPMGGCSFSPAWLTTIDSVLTAGAPALINILNIISIAKGQPLNTTLAAKITFDAAQIKTLGAAFESASAAAAPIACAQLQAAISVYSADQAQIFAMTPGVDPATQVKIQSLSALISGTVTLILSLIPSCQAAATMRDSLAKTAVPVPLRQFVSSYNSLLVVKTGNAAVDLYTAKHKVHVHSKMVRVLSFGYAQ